MEPKERILKGAEELFFRFGIKSITMDDIAKHLGMSKKTIYLFFNDKDELVQSLLREKLNEDERDFKEISEKAANVVEEVMMGMKKLGQVVGNINPNLFYDLHKYHPKAWKMFQEFKEKCILEAVERSLDKGKEQALVRPDINSKILAKLRIEQIEMGFNALVFSPDKFNVLEVQISLMDHFLHGVCTIKGHKLINKYKQLPEEE